MPKSWQITYARAIQSHGVWALDDDFTVQNRTFDNHEDLYTDVLAKATAAETADNVLSTGDAALAVEYAFFLSMNSAVYQRLDSEVPDDDPLQKDVDQIGGIPGTSRAAIDERTMRTVAAWKKVNADRAAEIPALPAVLVRGTAVAAYETRWTALGGLKLARETAAGVWRTKTSELRTGNRALDKLNKAWWQAWRSEYPPGTPNGDALAGVDTETGSQLPTVLEIAGAVQEGLSLRVTYVEDTGEHATVRDLLYKVEGVNADYLRVTVDLSGNVIGPFTAGQVVKFRTDVGNSRDLSEMSAEQTAVIAAVP